ncbi:Gamma tubulin complex protein 3 [Cynara cardunculus var. scolymus]|uniref:Gamma tubulin complex protein 3 n=1 Tax=Cynara cardunculus var. scolymus TaxID=59895 RepID=A0A103Y6P2_CYNCS|nr:Gamma tubulin complex protein 3 [Cynara cardunculus var. scolymus]
MLLKQLPRRINLTFYSWRRGPINQMAGMHTRSIYKTPVDIGFSSRDNGLHKSNVAVELKEYALFSEFVTLEPKLPVTGAQERIKTADPIPSLSATTLSMDVTSLDQLPLSSTTLNVTANAQL